MRTSYCGESVQWFHFHRIKSLVVVNTIDDSHSLFQSFSVLLTALLDFVTVSASDDGGPGLGIENILSNDMVPWTVHPNDIFGGMWVQLDFGQCVLVTKVVLDWSGSGYATEYELQVGTVDDWHTIRRSPDASNIHVEHLGKRPIVRSRYGLADYSHNQGSHYNPSADAIVALVDSQTSGNHKLWGIALRQMRVYGYKL